MRTKIAISIVTVLVFIVCGSFLAAHTSRKPLRKTEVLALVAGVIVSENIAYDIRSRGIAFVPDENFTKLLQVAGAGETVFAALNSAKSDASAKPESGSDLAVLRHLSHAGSLIRAGQNEEAAAELNSALASGNAKSEIGFVMGEVLINMQQIDQAGQALFADIE
jgi:hypothetical protein